MVKQAIQENTAVAPERAACVTARTDFTARAGQRFDLMASKLRRPAIRPGTIRRWSLLERLARDGSRPIVSVVAPPGYGKTTLLSQWASRSGRAFAWVSVDERDNDPKVLLTYIAEALDAVEPIDEQVFDALSSPGSSVLGAVVPRLGWALWSMTAPVVLVLDNVHVLHDSGCGAVMSVLAEHMAGGSRMVLAGRDEPPLAIARLRAEGKILEIGPGDLALTREDASSLLCEAGVALGEDDVAELHRRTEGWPAGLYLAALSLREGGSPGCAAAAFGGDDRLVAEYIESEFLARLSRPQRMFLTRTAVLERMCGPLCEAVLGSRGSAAALAELAQSNLLLVPLDQRGEWYRHHHLIRDTLLADLERLEPGLMPALARRAAGWCVRNGLPEEALKYSIAADDVGAVAHLVGDLAVPAYRQGRSATLQRWLRWLEDRGGIEKYPMVAVLATLLSALTGKPTEAERWADVVDRWQHGHAAGRDDPSVAAWAALLRAILCRAGVEQMHADADEAVRRFAEMGFVTPKPALVQGIARVLSGDLDGGDASLQDAVSIAEKIRAPEILATGLSERSLVAMARGEWSRAEVLAGQARAVLHRAGIEESFAMLLACAAHARAAMHRGDIPEVRQKLACAERLRHKLTYALPYLAVEVRIELARVYIALADLSGARTLMREIDELLSRRADLGTLVDEAKELRAQLWEERSSIALGESALTGAELRLLPMLATHLSVPEIAGEMFLSRHTVKSETISIYRRLGVSSRHQAVVRARDLGLLDLTGSLRASGE